MPISFNQVGEFSGVGNSSVLNNPTSLQFGPDGRLYVSEQNGSINAFTIGIDAQTGDYIATAHEELLLPNGDGVVKSLQNHNDDGTLNSNSNRQVTGVLATGTASEPVLYITSSDPRIATNGDSNLDTNSGVLTKVSWNSSTNEWEAVDLIRGLPRSEENHSVNGMVLSPDGTKLYLAVGGNTNNGAPSSFFSYTGEYALSGTVLEIDLSAIEALPTLTDPNGGQGGTSRDYKYDLPTLDDPNILNFDPITNNDPNAREDADGLDTDGPWGGNDGLNQAILPADAPLRIYADGLRNNYDLAITPDGKLYTVDNGSNGGLGGDPNTEIGDPDGDGISDEAISTLNDGGSGDPEPLFLIQEGGYYGHPNPVRSNQNQSWTVYNDSGDPDASPGFTEFVPNISALVPNGVQIAEGFLIDPSKFAGLENLDPSVPAQLAQINARLFESGVRVDRSSSASNKIVSVGSSTNGIVAYDSNGTAFNGVLDGKLFVTQFNDNITLLNLNETGDGLTAVLEEGPDGIFGTADDTVQSGGGDGILEIANNNLGVPLANPLDVTVGPNGTLWVAEIGGNEITVLAPGVSATSQDSDGDGILNVDDPFLRDPSNGTSVTILPNQTYLWNFSQGAGSNTPGPDGFGGGLTGVMIDGVTNFEEFLQDPSNLPGQVINLDNVKFVTAAGGGTTVIEEVSPGDPTGTNNSGEFLFHTGVTLGGNVGTTTISWSMFNPVNESEFNGPSQQIGAYIGTGDQSNFLKVAAVQTASGSAIQVLLENNDAVDAQTYEVVTNVFDPASIPANAKIFIDLDIDVVNQTATPIVTYETTSGLVSVPGLTSIDLAGTNVLTAIQGNNQVQGQDSGLAVGLFSSNTGQGSSAADRFQAIFDDIEITATEALFAPNAENDQVSTGVNTVLIIPVADLLANDTDPNPADTLTVTEVANPSNGTVVLDNNNTPGNASDDFVLFTPALNFEGTAAFTYTITDGSDFDTANVTVTVADEVVIYRVNAGGEEVAALASDPVQLAWAANTGVGAQSGPGFSNNTGNVSTHSIANQNDPGARDASLPDYVPYQVFNQERWDPGAAPEMLYSFDVTPGATYEVNLFLRNGFGGTNDPGERIFDIEIEGTEYFSDVDLSATYGHQVAAQLSQTLVVNDDSLDIEFLHQMENPLINAIEIVQIGGDITPPAPVVNIINGNQTVSEDGGQVFISLATNTTVPSGETVDVNFMIEPITSTPGSGGDYEYVSTSATFAGGVYFDMKSIAGGSSDLQIPINILNDTIEESSEAFTFTILSVSSNAEIGGNSEATVIIEDDDTVVGSGGVLFRINAGGPEVTATDGGPNWAEDQSAVVANGSAVAGTPSPFLVDRAVAGDDVTYGNAPIEGSNSTNAPDALFTTERFSTLANPNNIGYAFDVANGDYTVNLYFDELFFSNSGQRMFDVEIENTLVLDDFDTFATYGNATGLQSFSTTVTDNELNIEFLKGAIDNPHIAAIEIVSAETPDSFNGAAAPGNDFSDDNTNPNDVTLNLGNNILVTRQNPGDNDYITFEVLDGQKLIAANLITYVGGTNATFLGIETGDTFTSEDDLVNNGAPLEGGTLYDETEVGTDLLPLLTSTQVEGDGTPTTGLPSLLGPGLYTLWFGQNGTPASESTIELVTTAVPDVNLLVTPATGNEADGTVITVTITTASPVSGDQTVEFSLSGTNVTADDFVEPIPPAITILDGQTEASFTLTIANDAIVEAVETATFAIANPSAGLELGETTTGEVTITDAPVNPSDPNFGLELLATLDASDGIATGGSYTTNQIGAAVLGVLSTNNNVETSNFGDNSFEITNTGDKTIAAVFIDFRDAVFGDSVIDFDGTGGDTVFKEFVVNSGGAATGAFFDADNSNVYYLPGDPPLPNNTMTGLPSSGGFRGLLLKADNTGNGFEPNETVGFSGDMDPNSIAGLPKDGVDSGAINSWDVGGVSGAEIAGSQFFVLFDDGSTASGVLANNGTQAGSIGQAVEDQAEVNVGVTVNGGSGVYNSTEPTIVVNGPANQTVRVTLAKGFQPVTNDANGYEALVEDRLAQSQPEFQVNNAFDIQTVEVTIGQNGTATVSAGAFDYSNTNSGVQFAGDDVAPIAISAVAINSEGFAIGQVDRDYLTFDTVVPTTSEVSITANQNGAEAGEVPGQFTASLSQAVTSDTVISYSVGGTATAGSDYTALNGEVTILANQQSATITVPVIDDLLAEDPESVIVTLDTITAGDPNVVLGTATQATVTITDDDQSPGSLTIEAESITNVTNYRIENDGDASGGAMLSFVGGASNETGSASFTFNGASGLYNVILGTFDENDGLASLEVIQNATSIGTIELDDDLGSALATPATKVERTVAAQVEIANGDSFTINGFENGSEHARFDFIRFEPVNASSPEVSIVATQDGAEQGPVSGEFTVTLSQAVTSDTTIAYSVAGTATSGSDYTALSGEVTILATENSATIDVAVLNDSLEEGAESVIVTLNNITAGDANVVLGTETEATVTISDDDVPLSTIRLEAEAANMISGDYIGGLEGILGASGGTVLSFVGGSSGESGSAQFIFGQGTNAPNGTYDIVIGTYDENDGQASFRVDVTDFETGITTEGIGNLLLNANLGSNIGNAQTAVAPVVATGIQLTAGDIITVNGFEEGSEHARFDYLELIPTV